MSDKMIPLFYDHSSQKSILTYWKEKDCTDIGAQSIVKIAKDNNLPYVMGISDNFHTFFEAYNNLGEINIPFRFGLSLIMCEDTKIRSEDSRRTEHKIVIWMKNSEGYKDLIKIYSACHSNVENKYYIQRFDFNQLNFLWTDNLSLTLPFFDSFIHKNALTFNSNILPNFPVKPVIFREIDTGLPFEHLINEALDDYNKHKLYEEVKVKSIYYEKEDDFMAYMTYRAIQEREDFSAPGIEDFCSNNFSFEKYKELIK